MTFRFIIYTHQTILTQNTDQKFDHVSESGKLFCIFPLNKLDYRPTSKIPQIEIEIEELDELINTKLDPAEEY